MGCNGSKQQAKAGAAAPVEKEPLGGDFKITLERTADEQTVGLSIITIATEPGVLGVEAVKEEGLVPDFIKANANATEQHVVQGDRIIAVNDVIGDAEKMKAEMSKKLFVLTVQRAKKEAPATEEQPVAGEAAEKQPQEEPAAEPEAAAEKKKEEEPAVAVSAEETPAVGEAETKETKAEDASAEAAVPVAASAPAEEEPAAATDDAAAAAAAVEAPAMAKDDAAAADPAVGVEVAELQDEEVVVDEKEERLCKMAMC